MSARLRSNSFNRLSHGCATSSCVSFRDLTIASFALISMEELRRIARKKEAVSEDNTPLAFSLSRFVGRPPSRFEFYFRTLVVFS